MDLTARIEALEAQVRELRDMEEIRHLLSTYGFNADLGRVEEYLDGWTPDGVYDLSEDMKFEGREALNGLMSDPAGFQKTMIENRSQHMVANLYIKIDGDPAWVDGYSMVPLFADGGFKIFSAAYNHWDFIRSDGRWLMTLRTRRTVGGPTPGGEVIKAYLG